jgi:ribosomal-protein-alanine N-acetyltransferase
MSGTAGGPVRELSLEMAEEKRIPSTIGNMDESDLDEILRIEASSGWTSWSRHSFLGEIKSLHSRCFTLRTRNGDKDSLIGFICFRMVEGESELLNLAIHPDYRQKGFGRQLMQFYIDFCHEQKVETFYLETGVKNQAAIRFYRSFAYRPVGIRQKFYPENEDALLMARRASG